MSPARVAREIHRSKRKNGFIDYAGGVRIILLAALAKSIDPEIGFIDYAGGLRIILLAALAKSIDPEDELDL